MMHLSLAFAIAAVLVCLVSAGTVVINGSCRDCSPPVAETVVVDGKAYRSGKPGQGSVYINSPDAYGPVGGPGPRVEGDATRYPEGYSGRVPGDTYLHNDDCVGCSISGGGD
ncbi:bomanin Bicipital 1 [Drosophila obscura]|uniref:bomanin Bicipital 1 n=1 Tax=Drosophila obscura TaxID=7282 RepID=UPI000BA01E2B|nr:bomanin Bicipital 1 [Drosophila obscura]